MKSLAICIPTYKRPLLLKQCVLSAIRSAEGRPISVHIADDSLSDINDKVLNELSSQYPFVHVSKNEVNLGIDLNIQHVVDLCNADYAWLMGDDDQFMSDAVARMWDLLQNKEPTFIYANYAFVSEDHGRVLGIAWPDAPDGKVELPTFISNSLWRAGFIGGCVLHRKAFTATDPTPYKGTYYTHVGRIIDMLAANPRMLVVSEPSVANRAEGDDTFTWKKDSFGVFLGFERLCEVAAQRNPALKDVLMKAKAAYRHRLGYFSRKTVFRLRSQGGFDWHQYTTYVRGADVSPGVKRSLAFIACLPVGVAQLLARAYRSLRQRRSRAGDTRQAQP